MPYPPAIPLYEGGKGGGYKLDTPSPLGWGGSFFFDYNISVEIFIFART